MLVLVLDRAHRCLLEDGRLPEVALAGAARPLRALEARFAAAGVRLPSPAGSRARPDGEGRDFVFVTDAFAAPAGFTWAPLREAAADDRLWELYVACMLGGHAPPSRALDVWSFGNAPEMAAKLAHLVACGEKRVTMGWIEGSLAEGTPLAVAGGLNVVTDHFGYPRLVIRSVEVRELPFRDIDAESAAAEGEGDLTREDWHEGHVEYFSGVAAQHGLTFGEDALIAVERFEVLHVVGRR